MLSTEYVWGQSVSLSSDGKRLAIGVPSLFYSSFVQVYELVGNTWVQLGANIDEVASGGEWGGSVSLSANGNRIAIGSYHNDDLAGNIGLVKVYDWTGTAWVQVGANMYGTVQGDQLGLSVSLSDDGNRLVASALNGDNPLNGNGYARVYQWTGTAWTQIGADLFEPIPGSNLNYATSISSDGSRVAVGTPRGDVNGNNSGFTNIYELVGGSWVKMGGSIQGAFAGDESGLSLSLSGDGTRVIIGSPRHDNSTGHSRVFEWTGTNWVQLGTDIDGEATGDIAGKSVSISADGNKIAIGAGYNDGNGTDSGHTRLYEWSGGQWTQICMDIDGERNGDYSGWSVALASDGKSVAVSAPLNDDNGFRTGHVRVWSLCTPACTSMDLTLNFDNTPQQTSWEILDAGNNVVASGGSYTSAFINSSITENACLPDGCYTLNVYDALGNGLCPLRYVASSSGTFITPGTLISSGSIVATLGTAVSPGLCGNYTLSDPTGNMVVSGGGDFGTNESNTFCVTGGVGSFKRNNTYQRTDNDIIDINIFPNPVHDQITIEHNIQTDNDIQLTLIDVNGKSVQYHSNITANDSNISLNVDNLSSGIYLIQMVVDNTIISKKFIKK